MGPRDLRERSLAASEADVLEAGYSPPVPNPTIPRATVIIQNMLLNSAGLFSDEGVNIPCDCGTMGSCCQDPSDNDHSCGEDDGEFSSVVIAR